MTRAERKRLQDRKLAAIKDPEKDMAIYVAQLELELEQQRLLSEAEMFLAKHPKRRGDRASD